MLTARARRNTYNTHTPCTHAHTPKAEREQRVGGMALKWRQLWANFMNFECTHTQNGKPSRQPFCADTRPGGVAAGVESCGCRCCCCCCSLWLSLLSLSLPLSTSDDYLETPKQLHYFYEAGGGALRWARPLSGAISVCWWPGQGGIGVGVGAGVAVAGARRKFVCVN